MLTFLFGVGLVFVFVAGCAVLLLCLFCLSAAWSSFFCFSLLVRRAIVIVGQCECTFFVKKMEHLSGNRGDFIVLPNGKKR